MTKIQLQKRALALRKNGSSVSAIAKKLSVSKSTASIWCRDITLSETQLLRISTQSKHHATLGLLRAAEQKRAKRISNTKESINQGIHDVGKLTKRDIFMIGLGLYWGEGYKKGSQELGFTNSDSHMIIFYLKWLQVTYGIGRDRLVLRISINDQHRSRIHDIEKYWTKITNIPLTQFTKPSFIKTKSMKIYSNPESHFGTLRIKVRRGTNLRRRILGSIQAIH